MPPPARHRTNTEPVPTVALGGEFGAPEGCADHWTCSHARNCRYEDEGVIIGRMRERAV
jgi:hypothetical protein